MAIAQADVVEDAAERAVREAGIPPRPEALTRLLREARKDDPDFRVVAALLGEDVALAGAVLSAANSPVYGLAKPAASVQQALSLLGLARITRLMTGLLLRQAFAGGAHAAMERFWDGSAELALASALVAQRTRAAEADAAHTFGLFRDCGMAVMLQNRRGYASMLSPRTDRALPRILDAETEAFGVHHAAVGARLARLWMLPPSICAAVELHHSPDAQRGRRGDLEPGAMRLIAVAALAERGWADATGVGAGWESDAAAEFAEIQLGLGTAARAQLAAEIGAGLNSRSAATAAAPAASSRA